MIFELLRYKLQIKALSNVGKKQTILYTHTILKEIKQTLNPNFKNDSIVSEKSSSMNMIKILFEMLA